MRRERLRDALSKIPFYHFSNDRPFIRSWIAIASFCLWSSTMYVSLSVSYLVYDHMGGLTAGDSPVATVAAQYGLELLSVFGFTFVLVFCYVTAHAVIGLGSGYLAGFQYFYFFLTFAAVCFLRGSVVYGVLVSEFMLLPIQQGMILTILLIFSGRPINPQSVEFNSLEPAQLHFENWWRLARLGITGILSISIGAAITVTISDSSTLPISVLLGNIFLSTIPGMLLIVVMVRKLHWFNQFARSEYSN